MREGVSGNGTSLGTVVAGAYAAGVASAISISYAVNDRDFVRAAVLGLAALYVTALGVVPHFYGKREALDDSKA